MIELVFCPCAAVCLLHLREINDHSATLPCDEEEPCSPGGRQALRPADRRFPRPVPRPLRSAACPGAALTRSFPPSSLFFTVAIPLDGILRMSPLSTDLGHPPKIQFPSAGFRHHGVRVRSVQSRGILVKKPDLNFFPPYICLLCTSSLHPPPKPKRAHGKGMILAGRLLV